eukprot:199403-Amphidinium_carterae.1
MARRLSSGDNTPLPVVHKGVDPGESYNSGQSARSVQFCLVNETQHGLCPQSNVSSEKLPLAAELTFWQVYDPVNPVDCGVKQFENAPSEYAGGWSRSSKLFATGRS